MDNEIILYKVKWSFNSLIQPYYLSDSSRDTYLETCQPIKTNSTNVNIKLGFNREISLKVPIDIVNIKSYNFAAVKYNGLWTYSYIIDMEHISVNMTRLELRRHTITEKTNYFSYFKYFTLKKATFKDLDFTINKKFFSPDNFRYYKRTEEMNLSFNENIDGADITTNTTKRDFLIVYVKNGLFTEDSLILYNEPVQYDIIVIPIYNTENGGIDSNTSLFIRGPNRAPYIGNYTGSATNWYTRGEVAAYLDSISPNIITLTYTSLYVPNRIIPNDSLLTDVLPFYGVAFNSDKLPRCTLFRILDTKYNYLRTPYEPYYSNVINYDSNPFNKIILSFYSPDNFIEIETGKYYSDAASINNISLIIRMQYILNPVGTELLVRVLNNNLYTAEQYRNIYNDVYSFKLGDSTSYTLDSEALFMAENRYYEALTRNTNDRTFRSSLTNSITNTAIGASQMGFGAGMLANGGGGLGQISMGVGNIIRGISDAVQGGIAIDAYTKEREYLAKQESEKPDMFYQGGTASIRKGFYNGNFIMSMYIPYVEDLNFFLSKLRIYGTECYIVRDNLDNLDEFVNENKFFISGTAVKNDDSLDNREHNDLINLLHNGSIYEII